MSHAAESTMQVQGEVASSVATAQLVQFHMPGPMDSVLRRDDTYWLDLCLTPRPRNARARYCNRWNAQRFERLGRVFLLPAGESLQARSDGSERQTSVLCHLNAESMVQWFGGELRWTDQRLRASLDIPEANVHSLLLRLGAELRHPGFASETLVELIAAQLAIELGRYCASVENPEPRGGLAAWRLRLIDERLHQGPATPTLTELAELCGISVRQLTRGFRTSRGRSIGDYIAQGKLDRARQLLATGRSIKAIAHEVGFSSPSSFCYAFRRDTGETPGEYRERLRRVG